MVEYDEVRPPTRDEGQLSALDRALRIFTDVRAGEGATGLLMLGSVFALLASYYLIKPAREGLLATSGIDSISKTELKAYTSFGQSLLLLVVVPLFAWLSSKYQRRELLTRVNLFFISNMVLFWLLRPGFLVEKVPYLGIAFYLWVGIFNNLVIAQFWAFAADIYTNERGKRIFPMIAIGASAGAVAGSYLTEQLVEAKLFDTYSLILLAGGVLAVSIVLTILSDKRGPTGTGVESSGVRGQEEAMDKSGAFRLVFGHKYLLATAMLILVLNWVNSNGENSLYGFVQSTVESEADMSAGPDGRDKYIEDRNTAFYGNYQFWTNVVGLVLQALVASRLLRYGGFGAILLMLPIISLTSYTVMMLLPVLGIIKIMKIAENGTDYSINNTAKQVLWLPTTREMKYKAKAAIDTLFVRLGDGLAALTAFLFLNRLNLAPKYIFGLNIGLVLVWLALGVFIVREHKRLVAAMAPRDEATRAV